MSLKDKVMVVNLNISQWTARKYDRNVSREVETSHNAHDAGRFNKILIAGDVLKEIGKLAGSARTYHYYNTLAWGDNGDRVLPAANYFNYIGEMSKFKNDFDNLVQKFVSLYPSLIEQARIRLGTMFNEGDYPSPGLISDRFAMRFSFMPMAESEDFRIQISDEEIQRIKTDIEGTINSRVSNSISEMLIRIREAVSHMAVTLAEDDKVFRDSLVGNVCNLIEVIPLLNFNNDSHVNEVVKMIEPLCVDAEQLRLNKPFRKEVANKAKAILNSI